MKWTNGTCHFMVCINWVSVLSGLSPTDTCFIDMRTIALRHFHANNESCYFPGTLIIELAISIFPLCNQLWECLSRILEGSKIRSSGSKISVGLNTELEIQFYDVLIQKKFEYNFLLTQSIVKAFMSIYVCEVKRKKVIRTTEATDRCLITVVHSALVVYARLCVYQKCKKAKREKTNLFISREKGLSKV